MKYKIGQQVWIHLGDPTLTSGTIVNIFNLRNLPSEGHCQDDLYVVEIPTPIEPVYEVRSAELISLTPEGPINLWRNLELVNSSSKFLRKVGIALPKNVIPFDDADEEDEPTTEQIHAAIQRAMEIEKHPPLNMSPKRSNSKKRFQRKRTQ